MMHGKQRLLVNALYHSRVLDLLRHTAGSNHLLVFNYHRIRPAEDFTTEFDDGVFGPTIQEFTKQVAWLQRNTRILSESDLIGLLTTSHSFTGRLALITFDDGYRDNYDLAYPVLKQLGVPAIFFIPTQSIIERQLGWWDLIAYLIKKTKKDAISFAGQVIDRRTAISFFLRKMKLEPYEQTRDLPARLAEACDVSLPPLQLQDSQLMTWDQIRSVTQHNIGIGSHTHTHRVLATIPPAIQQDELATSKAILEEKLGQRVCSLSYPVGNYQHFTADTQQLAAKGGYKLAFSFNTGFNEVNEINRYDIKRVGPPDDVRMLSAMTLLPGLLAGPPKAPRTS